jgi:anthrone oxygenase-like protein
MTVRNRIAEISLWVLVICLGILTGATIFEALVITPLWAGSAPESVRGWNENPRYAIDSGKFFVLIVLPLLLSSLFTLIAGWKMPWKRRKWMVAAAVCTLIGFAATGSFFVPILRETIFTRGAGLSDAEIVEKVNRWVTYNWLRMGLQTFGWVAALRALSLRFLPPDSSEVSRPVETQSNKSFEGTAG